MVELCADLAVRQVYAVTCFVGLAFIVGVVLGHRGGREMERFDEKRRRAKRAKGEQL